MASRELRGLPLRVREDRKAGSVCKSRRLIQSTRCGGIVSLVGDCSRRTRQMHQQIRNASPRAGWGSGGAEGSRTPDLLIANETLCQLSYDPIPLNQANILYA